MILDSNLMTKHYSRRGSRKRSSYKLLLNVVLVFALVFYQVLIPFSIVVKADTESQPAAGSQQPAGNEPTGNENSNDNASDSNENENENKNENGNENKNGEIPKPASPAGKQVRDDMVPTSAEDTAGKQDDNKGDNCDVEKSELTDYCQEELQCEDLGNCLKKYSCGEIKKCLSIEVKNKNEAEIKNDVETSANSGENVIEQEGEGTEGTGNQEPGIGDQGNNNTNENANENQNCNGNLNSNSNSNSNANLNNNSNSNENTEVEEPDALIETGDSTAVSDVYNEVNTNIVSDNFEQTTINIEGTYDGDINLLEQFQSMLESDTDANSQQSGGSLTVSNENEANIDNEVEVSASTGENSIETEGGSALIQAGDATAVSNTVNVVNTNIVGNNVLFAVVNVYGQWNGDLIVPGEGLLEVAPEPVYAETVIVNENEADVENNVLVTANTGGNEIDAEGGDGSSAEIKTGAAYAGAEVLNIVNTNIVKNNFFFLLINNLGSWTGKILNWDNESGEYSNIFSYDFGLLGDGETPTIQGLLSIFNKNTAKVENDISASANTGNNEIEIENENGGSASAAIKTGNAAAMAKIVNFINTNIVGNNWLFGIVNIMGQWNGDTVFAFPDLTVSITDGKDKVSPGENINYKISYKNNGKADCKSVNILVTLPSNVLAEGGNGDSLEYKLAGLKPGEEGSFNISAVVDTHLPEGSTNLETLAGIKTETKENELDNNLAVDLTEAFWQSSNETANNPTDTNGQDTNNNPIILANYGEGSGTDEEKLEIGPSLVLTRKVEGKKNIHPGETVKYIIYIENTGEGSVHDVVVSDKMKYGMRTVGNFSWELGEIKGGKKYKISFNVAINAAAPAGTYTSTASAFGYDKDNNKVNANEARGKINLLREGEDHNANEQGGVEYQNQYTLTYLEGGYCYLDDWSEGLVNEADAAPVFLGGVDDNSLSNPNKLPFWMWIAAALSYFLSLNWSFFPRRFGSLAGGTAFIPGVIGLVTETVKEESEESELQEIEEEIENNSLENANEKEA